MCGTAVVPKARLGLAEVRADRLEVSANERERSSVIARQTERPGLHTDLLFLASQISSQLLSNRRNVSLLRWSGSIQCEANLQAKKAGNRSDTQRLRDLDDSLFDLENPARQGAVRRHLVHLVFGDLDPDGMRAGLVRPAGLEIWPFTLLNLGGHNSEVLKELPQKEFLYFGLRSSFRPEACGHWTITFESWAAAVLPCTPLIVATWRP